MGSRMTNSNAWRGWSHSFLYETGRATGWATPPYTAGTTTAWLITTTVKVRSSHSTSKQRMKSYRQSKTKDSVMAAVATRLSIKVSPKYLKKPYETSKVPYKGTTDSQIIHMTTTNTRDRRKRIYWIETRTTTPSPSRSRPSTTQTTKYWLIDLITTDQIVFC